MDCDRALLLMQKETLTEEEQMALQAHLDSCEECRQIYELTRLTDEAVASLEVEPPERLVEGTMWKIAPEVMEKRTGKKPVRRFRFAGTAIAAVAAAALLVIGMNTLKSPTEEIRVEATPTAAAYSEDVCETEGDVHELPESDDAEVEDKSAEGLLYVTGVTEGGVEAETDAYSYGVASENVDEPMVSEAYSPEMITGSCLAVLHVSDRREEIRQGDTLIDKMPVNDLRSWVETTFGVPESKLSRVKKQRGDISMLTITRSELEQLQEEYPEQIEVVEEEGDWEICTLVVMEEGE